MSDSARPTIELQMIVKNGAATLGRCLASVAPLVDRMVVGDTGSSDESRAIAKSFGAEVLEIGWDEDFSVARNKVLAQAKCDWVLVLDADEMLETELARVELSALIADEAVHAYGLWRRNYVAWEAGDRGLCRAVRNTGTLTEAARFPAFFASFHVRLFRAGAGIVFEHCVHESVEKSLDRLGLERRTGSLVLHHFGYGEDDAAVRLEKGESYYQLSLRRLREYPDDFESNLQLGICELQQKERPGDALSRLEHAVRLRPRDGQASFYLGICLVRLERVAEAQRMLLRAKALGENSFFLHDTLGDTYLLQANYASAVGAYQRAARVAFEPANVRAKQGLAEIYLGRVTLGLSRIEEALAKDPESGPLKTLLLLAQSVVAGSALVAHA